METITKQKTILLHSNTLWSLMQFRKELILDLQKKYRVVCVSGYDDFATNSYRISESLGIELFQLKIHRKGINPFQEIIYVWKLWLLYKKINPDLIIHYTVKPNVYGSIVANILKIPNLAVICGLGSSYLGNPFLAYIVTKLYKVALLKTNKILFLNQDDLNEFVNHHIITLEKSFLLPGEGINIDEYTPSSSLRLDEESSTIVFLMVARLLKDKGVYEYIDAIKQLKSVQGIKFLLVGAFDVDNPSAISYHEVHKWTEAGYVSYLGKTDDIKTFFHYADVIVLPSYREGLSRVLLEANSCEKFIITSDIAGCKELCVENKNGFLVKPKDVLGLKNAIEKTIALGRMTIIEQAKEGRKHVMARYSSQHVNECYQKLIQEIFDNTL